MNEPIRISPEMIRLYDEYTHLTLDRRKFMGQLTKLTGSAAAAAAIVPLLEASQARAAIVPEDDARLKSENITYPAAAGQMKGYLVSPVEAAGKLPAVIVIHENRGLNPHIEDIARRFALENFVAFAPDALTPLGGYPASGEDEARTLFGKLDRAKTVEDMVAGAGFLQKHPESTGKIGAVGFCWGGQMVNILATRLSDLAAAVPFYGTPPPDAEVPKIKAPLLIHYASTDKGINDRWPAFEAALKAANAKYTMHMYEGASHGFNNDTTPRYDEKSATLAWARTVEFFNANLRK